MAAIVLGSLLASSVLVRVSGGSSPLFVDVEAVVQKLICQTSLCMSWWSLGLNLGLCVL